MAAHEYYHASHGSYLPNDGRSGSSAPSLPPLHTSQYTPLSQDRPHESPLSPVFTQSSFNPSRTNIDDTDSQYYGAGRSGKQPSTTQYSDQIPLRENSQAVSGYEPYAGPSAPPDGPLPALAATESQRGRRKPAKRGFFSGKFPWIVYSFSIIQTIVFIAELIRNAVLTSIPIQIHPQFNPMIGPSYYVLINMGGRYIPCMKDISAFNLPPNTQWPCPNSTTSDMNDPSMHCQLSDLCGFSPVSNPPNQWFRFIIPIFLHGGVIHIGFNMLLQLTLGREMEKTIGSLRFLLVYLSSGIFGFVLGGNFAASGIVAMGASGSLFGIIAINLLDLLYKWQERTSPWKELIFIIIDIVISFVLGLLPGLDNFSHIGGFLMGLVLGICLLHSPIGLRKRVSDSPVNSPASTKPRRKRKPAGFVSFAKEPVGFFKGRKPLWWAWWLVRAGALLGVLICFIVLLNNFYKFSNTCSWCKYLSCLPVSNWCDVGNLSAQVVNTTNSSTPHRRDIFGLEPVMVAELLL